MKTLAACFAFMLMAASLTFAQRASLAVGGGITKDMRSETPNFWNMGFVGRAIYIGAGSGKVVFGASLAYHSRGADGDGWAEHTKSEQSLTSYSLNSVSGSQSVLELGPIVRMRLTDKETGVRPYLHAGVMLLLVTDGDVSLSGSYTTSGSSGTGSITYKGQSLTGFGAQVGLALLVANAIEIQPLYTLYTAGGDLYHHYTINVAYRIPVGKEPQQ